MEIPEISFRIILLLSTNILPNLAAGIWLMQCSSFERYVCTNVLIIKDVLVLPLQRTPLGYGYSFTAAIATEQLPPTQSLVS